jgi:hypothetical protein
MLEDGFLVTSMRLREEGAVTPLGTRMKVPDSKNAALKAANFSVEGLASRLRSRSRRRGSCFESASRMDSTSTPLLAKSWSRSTWTVVEFPWRTMLVSLPVRNPWKCCLRSIRSSSGCTENCSGSKAETPSYFL